MFYTRLVICLSLFSILQQTVMAQCLPLRGAARIDIDQCFKALASYQFDKNGRLDNDGYNNKKTCGNCALSMSKVSLNLGAKESLHEAGLADTDNNFSSTKKFLEESLTSLTKLCAIKGRRATMLPATWAGAYPDGIHFYAMEVEVGDMAPNQCSSSRRTQKN
ncbi:secreted protein [Melampsora americana]|nr:secreted protein [Melampsora americana]